jgi:hypothetical protein
MDLLPFDGVESHDSDEEEETNRSRRSLLNVGDEAGWCLFSIDARNTYGLPFEVTFERDQEGATILIIFIPPSLLCILPGTPKVSTTLVVPPGSSSRFVSQNELLEVAYINV